MARVESSARSGGVVGARVEVRVDAESDVRVGVPQLARHENELSPCAIRSEA
jgi:hypothetical protein